MKDNFVQGLDREQCSLLPSTIQEYIEDDNVARLIDVFLDSLDIEKIGFKHSERYLETKPVGRPPFDPKDLLKLYIGGYLNRARSNRRLEKECIRNLEVIFRA